MNDSNFNSERISASPLRRMARSIAARWVLLACLAVPTCIALFYAVENFRGARAWNNYRKQAEARGINLDFTTYIPAAVPDSENGALTPWVQTWFPKPRGNPDPFWPELKSKAEQRITKRKPDGRRHLTDLVAWKEAIELVNADADKKAPKKVPERDLEKAERSAAAPLVLNALIDYRPPLDDFRAASKKPRVRYPVDYKLEAPFAIFLPHLAKIKATVSLLGLQSSAELAMNKTDDAFNDILLMLWLTESLRDEPFIINQLVRVATLQITAQSIWEGIAEHQWSDVQLAAFQERLSKIDFVSSLEYSMSAERAACLIAIEQLRTRKGFKELTGAGITGPSTEGQLAWEILPLIAPRGWFRFEAVNYCNALDAQLLDAIDTQKKTIDKDRVTINSKEFETELSQGAAVFLQHKLAVKLLLPAVGTAARKYALGQVVADETAIACAVERYRLANGKLPDTLEALAPKFIAKVPHDVLTGQSLRYERLSDTEFSLSSVGWPKENTDESRRPFGWTEVQQSEWTWRSAAP